MVSKTLENKVKWVTCTVLERNQVDKREETPVPYQQIGIDVTAFRGAVFIPQEKWDTLTVEGRKELLELLEERLTIGMMNGESGYLWTLGDWTEAVNEKTEEMNNDTGKS